MGNGGWPPDGRSGPESHGSWSGRP